MIRLQLTLRNDVEHYIKTCDKYQKHATLTHQLAENLTTIISPWPFLQQRWIFSVLYRWLWIAHDFVLLATDYFTKSVKAPTYANNTTTKVIKFIRSNILTRFGIPWIIMADNGKQFQNIKITTFCAQYRIEQCFFIQE